MQYFISFLEGIITFISPCLPPMLPIYISYFAGNDTKNTKKGYSFPVYYDTGYSAAMTYSVSSLPTTYFIDAEGNLIAHARGTIDSDTLQRGIDMIYN